MGLRNTTRAWGSVAKSLHWIIAALIFTQFALGWTAEQWHRSPTKVDLFVWHKSIGILVLTLVVLRVLWRLSGGVPELPSGMSRLERRLAAASHALLYALILAMPLSGWVINSAANFPLKIFWLVPLPDITPPSKAIQAIAEDVHLALFWTLAAIVTLHVVAAFRHHFVQHDDVLLRMLPGDDLASTPDSLPDESRTQERKQAT
jgi:cytochrome b561